MTLQFDSRRNYMKKHIYGSGTMGGPNTAPAYTGNYYRIAAIPHNLGYVPFYRAFYEPYRDGRIMNAYWDSQGWLADPPNNYAGFPGVAPVLMTWADATNVYFMLEYQDGSLSGGTFVIHYVIYLDYGVA